MYKHYIYKQLYMDNVTKPPPQYNTYTDTHTDEDINIRMWIKCSHADGDEELTDEEIFSRTASYVMINTLIMRRRQLMREQIRLNERIALRKFDQMGLRGIKKDQANASQSQPTSAFGGNDLHGSPTSTSARKRVGFW